MRVWEILQEAVGGNYLFHGVPDGKTMAQILKSGEIKPMPVFDFDRDLEVGDDPDVEVPDRISLTRNQYLHFPYGNGVAQFVIDRDALKQKGFKIKPAVGAMIGHKAETEERVFKPIPLRSPFVVSIQYDPDLKVPKSFIDKVRAAGIKIEPWKKSKAQDEEPVYDLHYNKSSRGDSEEDLSSQIADILDKGTDPLPDWRALDLVANTTGFTIYYKIPGWTYGLEIKPFGHLDDENFAKRIFAQLQQLTKDGKSIRPILNKYAKVQMGKDWKQGIYKIRPGDPGYKHPDEDNKDRTE